MPRRLPSVGARVFLAFAVFGVLMLAITARPAKRLIDFDQSFYLTIAYDLGRYGVFSNGVFDDVDSTTARPPPGMFFSPLYPSLVLAAMKLDSRFARAVTCSIEANHKKRDLASCEIYARPMLIIHALFLAFGIVAIALTAELLFASVWTFVLTAALATIGAAAEAELFSYVMTESVWFSLYSMTMLAFVAGLTSSRMRYFLLAGILLGVLCLTRPSFLVLVPVLLGIMFVYMRWLAPEGPRPWLVHAAAFSAAFLVLIGPWAARNYVSLGKLALTEEYGSATLVERFAFNDMTAREFWLAFPYCLPKAGPAAVQRVVGPDVMARFEWNQPGSFFEQGRARRVALVAAHGRLDPIIGDLMRAEMAQNWWRHALTTVPLGWCGLWVSGLWSLVMIPLFVWACVATVQSRPLFLFYALPALLLVGLHAGVANHYSRYNLGLVGPFAVGGAWAIARTIGTLRPRRSCGRAA